MANQQSNLLGVIGLRNATAALTTVGANAGTELVDARLNDFLSGSAIIAIQAIDATSGDETYQLDIEGRDSSSGAWRVLGSVTIGAVAGTAVVGVLKVDIDRWTKRVRFNPKLGGTTPSLTCTVIGLGQSMHYQPAPATSIVS